ncbi:DUF2971 domain-containing protein [Microvirga sp. 0TCS3.31]
MQFDLRVEIDREAVKARALQKLWEGHYGDQVAPAGNRLGEVINALRGIFPRITREEFDHEFGEAIEATLVQMERSLPGLQEVTRSALGNGKILCLSEAPDNTLMWAHYADQHQGIVLRFRSAPDVDSPWPMARPVNYVTGMPLLIDTDFLADFLSGRAMLRPRPIMDRIVYTKSADWAYEREWRIFSGAGRNPNAAYEDVRFHPLELDAVILGCRLADEERVAFIESTRRLYPHAEILHAVRSERLFQLTSSRWTGGDC